MAGGEYVDLFCDLCPIYHIHVVRSALLPPTQSSDLSRTIDKVVRVRLSECRKLLDAAAAAGFHDTDQDVDLHAYRMLVVGDSSSKKATAAAGKRALQEAYGIESVA